MERGIGNYHPTVSFCYFLVVIGTSMLYTHPIICAISIITSILYSYILDKDRTKKMLGFTSVMAVLIAITNALFVNRGVTVLFYFRANPVTMESFLYGSMSGIMMASVVMWFSCYNHIVTSDKFLYIFGKILPSIALMANMTLRLIPKLIEQTKIIANTQKTMGLDYSEGSMMMKIKSSMRILSILVTWALEDAVQTADSMRARGYGMKKRSNFSIYNFITRDLIMILFIGIIGVFLLVAYVNGYGELIFYPTISTIKTDNLSMFMYTSFLTITLLPTILELMEEHKWKYLELIN